MKKIGIIGSGAVAKALGNGFIKHGYQVKLGTRDTAKLAEWLSKAGENASVGSFSEAAFFGDIVVLAVKGFAAKDALALAERKHLDGKTIIDTSNPIAAAPPVNGVLQYFTAANTSLMEDLQKEYPDAHFVKAFNSVGSGVMVNPEYTGGKPTMFICGNNDGAKAEVSEILDYFGYETEDMGKVEAARAVEALCMLWCIKGFTENQWTHAFKLLKK
jgi:predicted dinucleotide-binding enzyme